MKYCPECGVELKSAAKFCPECGAKLIDEERLSSAEIIEKQISNSVKAEKRKTKPAVFIVVAVILIAAIAAGLILGGVFKKEEPVIPFSDNTDAIQSASDSVIRLNCYDKDGNLYCTGSAFAAFEDGVFVTNYHVIEQEVYSILAYTEDDTMFEIASILAYDADKDMAIIKTNATTNIAPLPLASSDELEKGEKVVAIGSPLGLLNTVSTGVFSGYNNNGVFDELQFTASISSGSSGGALFNNNGEVIGITYASYIDGQNLNLAIPINFVKELWENKGEALSVSEFYESFEHAVYCSFDDFRNDNASYAGQTVYFEGYIGAKFKSENSALADLASKYGLHASVQYFSIFRTLADVKEYVRLDNQIREENLWGLWDKQWEIDRIIVDVPDDVFSEYAVEQKVGIYLYVDIVDGKIVETLEGIEKVN